MRRRSIALTALILLTAATLAAGALYAFLRQEPDFYAEAIRAGNAPAGTESEVLTRLVDLQNNLRNGAEKWGASFTADELNAILRDQLEEGGLANDALPEHVQAPRVAIRNDRILIGVRMQVAPEFLASDRTTTVVHIELRPWVVKSEQNVVAVEVCGLWAGGVPISSQRYLDRFSDAARGANVNVNWYRLNGNPVALMRLYADLPRPPAVVRSVSVADGKLNVSGTGGS